MNSIFIVLMIKAAEWKTVCFFSVKQNTRIATSLHVRNCHRHQNHFRKYNLIFLPTQDGRENEDGILFRRNSIDFDCESQAFCRNFERKKFEHFANTCVMKEEDEIKDEIVSKSLELNSEESCADSQHAEQSS